jgi:hypothetical protein
LTYFSPCFTLQPEDIVEIHHYIHAGPTLVERIFLSNDGVKEANSSATSLNIFALSFVGCRQPYVFGIGRPACSEGKELLHSKELIDELKMMLDMIA